VSDAVDAAQRYLDDVSTRPTLASVLEFAAGLSVSLHQAMGGGEHGE
jgi:hypothetical protein